MSTADPNPFVRYRARLDSHERWMRSGRDDESFVALVRELDAAVQAVDGTGFAITPFERQPRLAQAGGCDGIDLWVKNETVNVGRSANGRHLFGLLLGLHADGVPADVPLATTSRGNAAAAAAVLARAAGRTLSVFVPEHAEPKVVDEIERLGAGVTVCKRETGQAGDPAYAAFQRAVEDGAVAFSCQGTDAPGVFDGGRTVAWEIAESLADSLGAPARLDRVFVQVGGGALATSVGQGMIDAVRQGWLMRVPKLHAVQAAGAFPLVRAADLLAENIVEALGLVHPPITSGTDRQRVAAMLLEHRDSPVFDQWIAHAAAEPDRYMWAWEEVPQSIANGILDDVAYDWIGVVGSMFRTGGWPVIVDDAILREANDIARSTTGIDVDPTGTAGLAGMLECARRCAVPTYDERVAVMVTSATPD